MLWFRNLSAISLVVLALTTGCASPLPTATPLPTEPSGSGSTPTPQPTSTAQSIPSSTPSAQPRATASPQNYRFPVSTFEPGEGNSTFIEMLALLPDEPQTRTEGLFIRNLATLQHVFDIQVPEGGLTQQEFEERYPELVPRIGSWIEDMDAQERAAAVYGVQLAGYGKTAEYRPAWISGLALLGQAPRGGVEGPTPRYLGFDLRNIDMTAAARAYPARLEVALGRFDPEATKIAIDACEACPEAERIQYLGETFYAWGEDRSANSQRLFSPPAFDQVGRGPRILVRPDHVFRTIEISGMETLIAASQGQAPSLADAPDYRAMAEGLASLDAIHAAFSGASWAVDDVVDREARDKSAEEKEDRRARLLASGPLMRPFDAYATGLGVGDDGDQNLVVVIVHATEEDALANAELLPRRLSEGRLRGTGVPRAESIESMEVAVKGRVLLARIHGNIGWADWIFSGDPALLFDAE